MILTSGMAHPRKLIRQAVVAALAGVTAAGARVYGTRIDPLRKVLPAIAVYTLREPIDADASANTSPRELVRVAQVEVVGFVAHSDAVPVDDAMDDLAEQIETAMDVDPYLGGKAGDSVLEETVMEVRAENGGSDPLVGIVVLTYSVTYRTSPAAPALPDDFITVDAKHQLVGGIEDDTVPAEDTFTVQEP